MLTDDQRATARALLDARAQALRDEIHALDAERGAPRTPHDEVTDAGEAGEQRTREATRDAEQGRDSAELRAVMAALARLEQGSYGICVDCGNDIPWPRLQVQPAAARDIACQTAWEQTHPPEVKAPPPGPAPRR